MALGDIIYDINKSYNITDIEIFESSEKVAFCYGYNAVVYDLINDKSTAEYIHGQLTKGIELSNDETKIASFDSDNVKVWDAVTGDLITTFSGHISYETIRKVAFTKDDSKVVSVSNSEIHVWEITSNNISLTFTDQPGGATSLAISTEGTMIASGGGYDDEILIWDISTGNIIHTLTGHSSHINSIEFHPDGDKIISGSSDNTVKIWDISTEEVISEFTQHTGAVNSCVFFPDGEYVISGGEDSKLYIWDSENNDVLYDKTCSNGVDDVACNSKGSMIAAGIGKAEFIELIDTSGLVLKNNNGQLYNTDPDYLNIPVKLGRIMITESSDIYELNFQNNNGVSIKNVNLSASAEKTGTDLTFGSTMDPFEDLQSITFEGPYEPGTSEKFYIRLNTDLEAVKGENNVEIDASAEFAY
ncbi:MAG TPA: WD40 repeat domain-containing protein [Halanaerobiales bacterium]|nr:WD40 repeat domain-containing protein [Halanaerobiales bacterium]